MVAFGITLTRIEGAAAQAREFEEAGFDIVGTGEHVSFNVSVSNSFISLAAAAGATSRIELMSTIVLVPLYPAALLAKLAATLDVASGGRYHLGVGIGGELPHEFEACGVPVAERGPRTDEALALCRRLFTERDVDFDGRFTTCRGVNIDPAPIQKPLPIWVAGRQKAAMRRAAHLADGWLPYMYTPEMLHESIETIDTMRRADGKSPIRRGLFIFTCVHPNGDEARRMAVERLSKQYAQDFSRLVGRYALAGTPDEVAAQLRPFLDAGAETVMLASACHQSYTDENHRLLAAEVLPAFR